MRAETDLPLAKKTTGLRIDLQEMKELLVMQKSISNQQEASLQQELASRLTVVVASLEVNLEFPLSF